MLAECTVGQQQGLYNTLTAHQALIDGAWVCIVVVAHLAIWPRHLQRSTHKTAHTNWVYIAAVDVLLLGVRPEPTYHRTVHVGRIVCLQSSRSCRLTCPFDETCQWATPPKQAELGIV